MLWWKGPEFLQQEEVNWPGLPKTASANLDSSPVAISEIKTDLSNGVGKEAASTHVHLLVRSKDGPVVGYTTVIPCEAHSDVQRLSHLTALVIRFVNNVKKKSKAPVS